MDTQAIIAEIDSEISKLEKARTVLIGVVRASAEAAPASRSRKRPKLSKEGRERIAAAQRKRWAEQKAARTIPTKADKKVAAPTKKTAKRKMSAEAKKRIAETQKKRWAAIRAARKVVKIAPAEKVEKKTAVKKVAATKKVAAKKAPAAKVKKAAPEKANSAATEAAKS